MHVKLHMKHKLNLAKNILLSNIGVKTTPYKITFALTYLCNLRCRICRIWKRPQREELAADEIVKIFGSLDNLSWLDLTGGEVFIRDDAAEVVLKIVESTKKLAILHISTNGFFPEKVYSLAKELIKKDLILIITVSIDAPGDIHDNLRGVKGSYARAVDTFKMLKSLKRGYYYISCTLSKYNIGSIDELIAKLKRDVIGFSLSDLHFNLFHNSLHYYDNQDIEGLSGVKLNTIEKYMELTRGDNLLKRFLSYRYSKMLSRYWEGSEPSPMCHALRTSCFIDPYGEVYPCIIYNSSIGNLKYSDYSLSNLWDNEYSFRARESIKKECDCCTPCEAFHSMLENLTYSLSF